ncbi:hypothetical protein ElyMa_006230700 [Elysia marginata]|uniref:Telomere-associated protein Rif1 N-terminal domain-containing protein n=1 Tax=Elysia marginata TaxID=1093978 RepID=A0AAV4H877_9GAST|nr:hypothetical protein ElyMa_006230700 [Elysia marginata]
MAATFNHAELSQKCKQEIDALVYTLQSSTDEKQWISSMNKIEKQVPTKESRWGVLCVLKSVILNMELVSGLKNLMQIFIVKISDLITENAVLEKESSSSECLALLKDFWALSSNQHYSITKQMFGIYNDRLYDVLPSMASLYIDLFVASNKSKEKTELLSKRLYGWLNMDLNERCLKTAFLEVSQCTSKTATFLLPILRKMLLSSPAKKSFMDYLLHFLLLRRWALVSKDLTDVVQVNLNVKAPKNFVDWLCQRWHQAKEYIPQDKSLKGRRVSELLCSLDTEAVEDLIEVFSQCLLSGEKENPETAISLEDGTAVADLFVIDKSGSGQDGPPSKKRKLEETTDAPSSSNGSHRKSNGAGSKENLVTSGSKMSKTDMGPKTKNVKNNNNQDTQKNENFSLGFVVDRTAGKRKRSDSDRGQADSNEELQGKAMEVDGNADSEADTNDNNAEEVVCNENKDSDEEDDAAENKKNDEKDVADENEDSDEEDVADENEESDEEDVADENEDSDEEDDAAENKNSDEEDVADENQDSDEEDAADKNGDTGQEDVMDESEDNGEEDDNVENTDSDSDGDENKDSSEEGNAEGNRLSDENDGQEIESDEDDGEKENKTKKEMDVIKPPAKQSAAFPICEKDPALSYFVNVSPKKGDNSKEPEIEVIEPVALGKHNNKTTENFSSVINKSPDLLKTGGLDDENKRKRKKETSESKAQISTEMESLDPSSGKSTGAKLESKHKDAKGINLKSPEESQSNVSKNHSKNSESPSNQRAFERLRKTSKSSLESDDVKKALDKVEQGKGESKSSQTRSKQLSESIFETQVAVTKQKSPRSSQEGKIVDKVKFKSQRLRSESELSQGRMTANLSPERSNLGKKGVGSPQEITEVSAMSPKKTMVRKSVSPKRNLSTDSAVETRISLTEESQVAAENTEKKVVVTEDEVGFVLSQIRSSSGNNASKEELTPRPTRHSTRLRTKSESSDVQSKVRPKTTAKSERRQTLTGIKTKIETSKLNADKGSAKILADWLRKSPGNGEEVRKGGAKLESIKMASKVSESELSQSAHLSSSDNEITFKKTPKTYTGSAKKRRGSPQRILIEPKSGKSPVSDSGKDKSPSKDNKSDTSALSKHNNDASLNTGDDIMDLPRADAKTPKSSKHNAKLQDNVESIKVTQVTPRSKKTPVQKPQSQKRKYFLRGTSPLNSPPEQRQDILSEVKEVSSKTTNSSPSVQKAARKSPAERRKSLRSSSKQQ